jgi:diadenylate cyclase
MRPLQALKEEFVPKQPSTRIEKGTAEDLRTELRKIAPGTALRDGIDMVRAAHSGALIVIGDDERVIPLCNGGFDINVPFTPQRLYELAKMDGAIVMDNAGETILKANVHLVPDPELPTSETGMRHRAAERISLQTRAIALALSQRRATVNIYLMGRRFTLEETETVLVRADQALQTLLRYRSALDATLGRLTTLEFQDLVTMDDITEALGRFETVKRVAKEVARYVGELGTEGRLVKMQMDELTAGVDDVYLLFLRDYSARDSAREAQLLMGQLSTMPLEKLLEPETASAEFGLRPSQRADEHLSPRGYRVLAEIPMLPIAVINRIVDRFGHLPDLLGADAEDLVRVEGVGSRRARAITSGLSRVRSHVAVV